MAATSKPKLPKHWKLSATLSLLAALPSIALAAAPAKAPAKALSSPAELAAPTETKVLWKQYYLYAIGGKPMGYFEETAERRGKEKQLAVSQRWVETEGGRTETYIGSVAADDEKLSPVAFFSERTGAGQSYKLDGRAKGTELSMSYRSTTPPGPPAQKKTVMKPGTILANFLPLFLAKLDPAKGAVRFYAVVEDARDGNFETRAGTALLQAVKKEIQGQSCRKARVEFNGQIGEWWIATDGRLCEFTLPELKAKLTLSTEEAAKKAIP
jgi:hypothetical protein